MHAILDSGELLLTMHFSLYTVHAVLAFPKLLSELDLILHFSTTLYIPRFLSKSASKINSKHHLITLTTRK